MISSIIFLCSVCVTGVSCGPPHPLENGLIQGTDFHASSSVVYQCNAGFYLLGDTKVHCSNSGKWGGNPPACLGTSLDNIVIQISDIWRRKIQKLQNICVMYLCAFVCVCVQMWMSVLWDLTVTNTLVVRTRRAPTPVPASTRTAETAKTAQVTGCRSTGIHVGESAINGTL